MHFAETNKFVQEAASLIVHTFLRLLLMQNFVSLVSFDHYMLPLLIFLQSKLSKLSQAPKLEPLNEGGGAALLQVVSLEVNLFCNQQNGCGIACPTQASTLSLLVFLLSI